MVDNSLGKVKNMLESLIMGKTTGKIELSGDSETDELIDLLNILNENMAEANGFVKNLAAGNVNADVPGRRNYLAAPLKELHSQMNNYVWIAQQIKAGKVVDKLDFAGEFGDALNTLIDMALYGGEKDKPIDDESFSGLRNYKFHQLYLAFNHLKMMVIEVDESGNVIFANKAATSFFGPVEVFSEESVKESARGFTSSILSIYAQNSKYPQTHEIFDDNSSNWYKITIDMIQLPNRENVNMFIIEDVNDIKSSVQALTKDATIDYLSNASNRKEGMKALDKIAKDPNRSVTYCAAFMDMDKLKKINDTYGHIEGDFAIKCLAEAFMASVRNSDIVSRFGGDEFLIIFHNCTLAEAERAIARMRKSIEKQTKKAEKPYDISFSYGLMEITPDMEVTVKDIIMLLDKRMYERKSKKTS